MADDVWHFRACVLTGFVKILCEVPVQIFCQLLKYKVISEVFKVYLRYYSFVRYVLFESFFWCVNFVYLQLSFLEKILLSRGEI